MKRLYYKILRDWTASRILAALMVSSERYRYIADMVESGKLSQEEATAKNINKAYRIADQFIDQAKNKRW